MIISDRDEILNDGSRKVLCVNVQLPFKLGL